MSLSSPGAPGPLDNAVAGYRLALAHPRRLLSVLLPVLVPALIGLVLLDLLVGHDHMVIVNDDPVVPGEGIEVLVWSKVVLVAVCWLLALSAAALTATGAARGHAVRPFAALLAAVRHFPVFAAGMITVGGATLLLLWAVAGIAGAAGGGATGLTLIIGALVAAAFVAARLLVGLVAHQLGGFDWRLTRGRAFSTAGAFLLGGIAFPLLLAYLSQDLRTTVTAAHPVVGHAIGAILVTGLVAVQAGILAHVYLLQREGAPAIGQESTDLTAVDARLADLAGGAPRLLPWLATAATVIAVLAPTGVALANPYRVPTVLSHANTPSDAVAVAWPAGHHPVIATMSGARFCDNDACDRSVSPNGGPTVMDGHGTAGISADGDTVVKATLTGGEDRGGPFIHYARCRRDGCREAWVPLRASAKEPVGWPYLAAAVAPDDAIWFVLAMPSDDERPGKPTYRITFVRCADIGCAKPQRHQAGTFERLPDGGTSDQQRARLSIRPDGRPVAAVRSGNSVSVITCDPVTCAAPRSTDAFVGEPGSTWVAPTDLTEPVVSWEPGTLRIGEQTVWPEAAPIVPSSEALTVSGSHAYAAVAELTNRPGLHVTIGESAGQSEEEQTDDGYWQQVLWRCDPSDCRRQVLDTSDEWVGHVALAVAADGRVLIVRQDRILLVSAPTPN